MTGEQLTRTSGARGLRAKLCACSCAVALLAPAAAIAGEAGDASTTATQAQPTTTPAPTTPAPTTPAPTTPAPTTPAPTLPAPTTPAPLPTDPDKAVAATVKDPLALLVEPGSHQLLSDELTVTRFAHAQALAPVLARPRRGAATITHLRYLTEDEAAEVYVVLSAKLDTKKRMWLNIRLPMRPNGRTGWIPADDMSALYVVRTRLVIDRTALKATLYKNGRKIWQAPVGVGKAGTPTPRGRFWIRELLKGLGDGSAYGPWAFGTSAYSNISDWPGGGVVGIHGTNEPNLIPGRPSHGCVRVRNDQIRRLARLMPVGTPVQIVG